MAESIYGLLKGFGIAITPINLLYCFLGSLMGTVVGILPGIGPVGAIAMLLPATFNLNPTSALIMLSGIVYGSMYGGSTTSILINIPGESASIITCLDGYAMARKGRAGVALGVSAVGSFIAGTFAVICLTLFGPPLAKLGLKFGPPEYFSLMVMSLSIVAYLARFSMIKALMMACLGLLLSVVGLDPITGKARFVLGIRYLYDGLPLPAIVMGLFGISEVIENISKSVRQEVYDTKVENLLGTREDWKQSSKPIVRGSILGFFLGIIPGIGAFIPTIISYIIEKRLSKHPEKFGTGEIEGVAAPEACNNAAIGGTFLPLLSLGIPCTGTMALLLAALMIYGVNPGPLLIKQSPNLFWGVIASMYIGNVFLVILNLPLIPIWVKMLKIPYSYFFALILLFCLIGAYSLNNNPMDMITMMFFGIFGYVLRESRYELPPFILAFILGPIIEPAFRRSMILSKGSITIFLTHPISAIFLAAAFTVLILPSVTKKRFGAGLQMEE